MAIAKKKHDLVDPIPAENNKELTSVELMKPRLVHVEAFALAVGADVLKSLIEGAEGDKEAVSKDVLSKLIGNLIKQERFDLFNEAIAKYLSIEKEQAELLSVDDLFDIGMIVFDFFQELSGKISELLPDTDTE